VFVLILFLNVIFSLGLGMYVTTQGSLNIFNITGYSSAALFFLSFILIYRNISLGVYLFSVIVIVDLLLLIDLIGNFEYILLMLVWSFFGIFLAYKTHKQLKINQNNL
jgi:hypothetical protein